MIFKVPRDTKSRTSSARQANSSGVRMKCPMVGRVSTADFAVRRCGSKGGTWPLAAPYRAIRPRTRTAARLASKVDFPTPS
ncbi:Uncharacterised protein [Mycobacteroides abscessus subsp. abscessus]|nr:Uncharacterised protein [Mycobacteroides abscessus subsp. abscessus]